MEGEVFSSDGGRNRACCCRGDGIGKFREHILENVEATGVGFCFIILFFFSIESKRLSKLLTFSLVSASSRVRAAMDEFSFGSISS